MDLSIIIPVFNEGKKIAYDIQAASSFLQNNNLTGEIIVVDDGSTDQAESPENALASFSKDVPLKVIRYDTHRGKGFAVRSGVKESAGRFVMFADSGSCVPYQNALDGLKLLKHDICDIAHGSRKLPQSKIRLPQAMSRRLSSAIFRLLVIYLLKVPAELTDTQCGFKIYKGNIAKQLYNQSIADGFMFDIEIILLAKKSGCRIKEFPIQWSCDPDSRLSPAKNLPRTIKELMAIKKTLA